MDGLLSDFLSTVTEPRKGFISPQRMSQALRMPISDLSRVTHLHRNTLAVKPDSPKVQDQLGRIARIVATAAEMTGDTGQAIVWFRHQPLSGFDGRTAQELVEAGHADAVLAHLDMLRDGVYG